MANSGHEQTARDVSEIINDRITEKVSFLRQIEEAVKNHQDKKIYQLLDNRRYAKEIEHREQQPNNQKVMSLVDDITNYLGNFLSVNLIDYLGKKYPFFYYEEYETGHYRIYFGNWWDRREFGELDVLNVRFLFKDDEYNKLKKTFELAHENKRFNSDKIDKISAENDHLQDLIDHQREREEKRTRLQEQLKDISSRSGIWESTKNKESRQNLLDALQKLEDEEEQSRTAAQTIKDNERVVLSLSKENTILSYEQKSILDTFSSFEDFELANRNLYADYIKSLNDDGEKQVTDDEQ